jgi:PAS domain S-box-containing protein
MLRERTGWRGSPLLTTASGAVLVCAGCYAGATGVGSLRLGGNGPAIVFPPYAVLMTALVLSRPRLWWVYLLAASAGVLAPHLAISPTPHVLFAELANYAKALIAAAGVRWYLGARPDLNNMRAMALFLLFAGALGPMAAGLIGAASATTFSGAAHFGLAWRGWTLSNALTGLTLLPVLLLGAMRLRHRAHWPSARRLLEAAGLGAALLAVGLAVFSTGAAAVLPSRLCWPLPLLVWAAVRFGPFGTSLSLLVVTVVSISGAVGGHGPFAANAPAENVLELQFFLIVTSLPLLLLSALVREQRATADKLRAEEHDARRRLELLDTIYRTVPAGLAFIDRKMRYVNVSDRLAEWHGVPIEAHVGRPFRDFLPPEVADEAEANFRRVFETGDPLTNVDVSTADGARQWVVNYHPTRDDDGRVIGVNTTVEEVGERRRAEERLSESESRFRMVADSVPAFLYLLDPDGKPCFLNKPLLAFHGMTEDEFMRSVPSNAIHPDDRDATDAGFAEALRARRPFACEFRLRRHDGAYRWFANTAVPRVDPAGRYIGYAGSCLDVSDRVLAEVARRETETALRGSLSRAQELAGRLIASQENERTRIARELHDDVNQQVAALSIALSALKRRAPGGSDLEHELAELQDRAIQVSEEIRSLSHEFHPGVLRHAGLVAALQAHCGAFRERHRIPSTEEIAIATGLSVRSVKDARSASIATVSLDEPVLPDGSPLAGLVADPRAVDPELRLLEQEQTHLLAGALADLPERQRRIVRSRWGIGEAPTPNGALAAELALSPRRTQTICRDALYDLRDALVAEGGEPERGSGRRPVTPARGRC